MTDLGDLWRQIWDPIKPDPFDTNEWYALVITVLTVGLVVYLHLKHRKLLTSEFCVIVFTNFFFAAAGDYLLAVKPIDLYDTLDHDSGELFDILLHGLTYPATIYIFLHFYHMWNVTKVRFLFGGAAILTIMEWVSTQYFNLFTYKGWNIYYSYPFYLLVLGVNLGLHLWVRDRYMRERRAS